MTGEAVSDKRATTTTDDDAGQWRLFELAPRLARLENAVLKRLSPPVTFGQFRILRKVAAGRDTLTELGSDGTLSLAALSESVDALVRKGALERETDRRDRRSMRLSLTGCGERLLEDGHRLLDDLAAQICGGMTETRRLHLREGIEMIDDRVTDLLRGGGGGAV